MTTAPSPRGAQRRPWYLVLALLICSGLGACGSTSGWATVEIYRGAQLEYGHDLAREEDRKAVTTASDKMLAVMDVERPRLFPLAVAELVLGIAMFVLAAAAMTGRGGARRALVQIVIAQAALVVLTFALTTPLRMANIDLALAQQTAKDIEHGIAAAQAEQQIPVWRAFFRGMTIMGLIVQTVVSALVVVALTRQRARAFYDSQNETPTES